MNQAHHHRFRTSLLAGTMVMAIGLLGGTAAAQASDCVVGPGVTQNDTTVNGSPGNDTIDCGGTGPAGKTINGGDGNDTITGTDYNDTITGGDGNDTLTGGTGDDSLNGGLGKDTISGSAGNDTLVGASNDGSQDSLDGGLGDDTCQGPATDPDIHASCEFKTMPPASGPGSSTQSATDLCKASGGAFELRVSPVGYACVFPLLPVTNHRVPEARKICTGRGGTFLNLALAYTCVLPN